MTTSKSIPTTTVSRHSVSNRFVTPELIRSTTQFINGSATSDDWRQFLWKFGFQIFCAILLLFITIVFFMYGMIVFNRIRRDHRSRSRTKSKLRSKPSVSKGDKTKKISKHRRHSRTRTLESATVSTTRTTNNRHKDKKHRDVSTTISGHSAKAHHNRTPHNHTHHKGHNNKKNKNKPERVQTDLSVLDDMSRADAQISNSINYSKNYSSSSAIDNSQSVISAYSPENDPSVLKRKPKTKTPEIIHPNQQQQKPKTKRSKIRFVKTKDPLITKTWKNNGRNKHSKMRKKTVSLSPNESKTTISNSTNFSNVFTSIKKN